MKNLKEFSAHSNYAAFLQTVDYIEPNVSLCVTENEVHYNPYVAPPASYNLLDILYSDANGNLSVDSNVLPTSEGKTPIGLCVAATGFFGSGEKARFMSLKWMNYTTPEAGSTSAQGIYMGQIEVDIATIPNITKTYSNGSSWGYLTADWITGTDNKIPSLFTDESKKTWNTSVLGTVNEFAVTDINGKAKTVKWVAAATAQPNWKTDSTITNSQESGYSPAACCCYRYHTLGTSAGDWYLGAGGEMAMINVLRDEINTKLTAINAVYSDTCISSISDAAIWSSTEYGSNHAYIIDTHRGDINYIRKLNDFRVLALFAY
jgi:hypothetical protein